MKGFARWTLVALAGCAAAADGSSPGPLRIATFECDATPPPGHPACGGWIAPLASAEAPLLLKGVILDDGAARAVVAALDWCRLHGGAYDLFRRRIAQAAEVPETRVAVQCTHAHDAPLADTRAQELLERVPQAPRHLDLAFMDEVTRRAACGPRRSSRWRRTARAVPATSAPTGRSRKGGTSPRCPSWVRRRRRSSSGRSRSLSGGLTLRAIRGERSPRRRGWAGRGVGSRRPARGSR